MSSISSQKPRSLHSGRTDTEYILASVKEQVNKICCWNEFR